MLHIPVLRWGEPYKSLDLDKVIHFTTGEPLAEVSRANSGLVERDMKHAGRARKALQEIPIKKLLEIAKKAGELYATACATKPKSGESSSPRARIGTTWPPPPLSPRPLTRRITWGPLGKSWPG